MKKLFTFAVMATFSLHLQAAAPLFTPQQLEHVATIRDQAMQSPLAFDLLTSLTTEIGPRYPGTENDKLAVKWAQEKLTSLGFDKVWLEPAHFPDWRRYSESGSILTPSRQPIHLTALGNSISTPKEGITADVIKFETLEELTAAPAEIAKGKIVFMRGDSGYIGDYFCIACQLKFLFKNTCIGILELI